MFLVYSSSTFDMVMIDNEFMHMFAKCLAPSAGGLGGRFYVSMVLRCCLPANAPYWLGRVVDRGSDSSVESFVLVIPDFKDKTRYVPYVSLRGQISHIATNKG